MRFGLLANTSIGSWFFAVTSCEGHASALGAFWGHRAKERLKNGKRDKCRSRKNG